MKKATDEQLKEKYQELGNVWKVAEVFGMCGQSVHERLQKMGGVDTSNENAWSEEDIVLLTRFYTERIFTPVGEFNLDSLAALLKREKSNISRKAKSLGLTINNRKLSEQFKKDISDRSKKWHQENEHPKGMLGKKHSEKIRQEMSERVKRMWAGECDAFVDGSSTFKALKTKHSKGILYGEGKKGSWKAGKRTIGGKEIFFRSAWEANYARYLELLLSKKIIAKWEFEPDTFWFHKIQRGIRSYLPDFKIWLDDKSFFYVEIKGWMDDKSKTKLKRMEQYYPDILVNIVIKKDLTTIEKKFSYLIPDWEFKSKIKKE